MEPCFSNFKVHTSHTEDLVKNADSDSIRLRRGVRFCIFNKLLVMLKVLILVHTWNSKASKVACYVSEFLNRRWVLGGGKIYTPSWEYLAVSRDLFGYN
jgi:hypothetical protein